MWELLTYKRLHPRAHPLINVPESVVGLEYILHLHDKNRWA